MKIKLKREMYIDTETDALYPYLDKLDYPWCHEFEDYITLPKDTEIVGSMWKTEFIGYRYPSIIDTRVVIYADKIDDENYFEVIRE